MAKVLLKTKDLDKKLAKKFYEFTTDEASINRISRKLVSNIKSDTRKGVGYDGESFPKLKPSTIDRREKLSLINPIDKDFDPPFSNATFMGDTIRNIISVVKTGGWFSRTVKIELSAKGKHRKIKGYRVQYLKGSNNPNNDALFGLIKRGWKILGMSKDTKQFIKDQFLSYLRRRKNK